MFLIRIGLVATACLAVALIVVHTLVGPVDDGARLTLDSLEPPTDRASSEADAPVRVFAPVRPYGEGFVDDSGYPLGYTYTGPVEDRRSFAAMIAASRGRADRGIAALSESIPGGVDARPRSAIDAVELSRIHSRIALLLMYEGRFEEAERWHASSRELASYPGVPQGLGANLEVLQGVGALRSGELANCVACLGPSSCIFPIAGAAVHQDQTGSRRAIEHFTNYLNQRPTDLGVRWLLNLAHMTVGEYPAGVPSEYLLRLDGLQSGIDVGQFTNVAPLVGLNGRGPDMAGGVVFDDFTGDGRPDLVTTSTDWETGAAFFVNRGDGTFEDRSTSAGLDAQVMSLNGAQADFDNDGDLDIVMTRGAWEDPYRLSLLRNAGDGTFEDVTAEAGLDEPIATQVVAWGDYDNDGLVDLFVGGEYLNSGSSADAQFVDKIRGDDPVNLCRLYRNQGDGTFVDVALEAGVDNMGWTKGAAWGDYDGDGFLDLYLSNVQSPNRLYRNQGDGTFVDVALELGVGEPLVSFACWFWDFDNDGRLDIFVGGYLGRLEDVIAGYVGQPSHGEHPRLYRNLGPEGFRDVTAEVGLDRVWLPMGCSFGDIDNDGYEDIYLATGKPAYSDLMPNVLLKNDAGRRFVDVTTSSGTGHLQKGHGVAFADYDDDGDLDLFVQAGGATPGDRSYNLLFQNPGHGRRWLKVRLEGTRSNRSAIGATIRVDVRGPDGSTRSLHRLVSNGSSFGGNSLVAFFGLGEAESVDALSVTWPGVDLPQTFRDVAANQTVEIVEGSDEYEKFEAGP